LLEFLGKRADFARGRAAGAMCKLAAWMEPVTTRSAAWK
jgi:hypothetical protein